MIATAELGMKVIGVGAAEAKSTYSKAEVKPFSTYFEKTLIPFMEKSKK